MASAAEALLFNGSLLHGVIPNLASPSATRLQHAATAVPVARSQESHEPHEPRITLMMGLWGQRPPCCSLAARCLRKRWHFHSSDCDPGGSPPPAPKGELGRCDGGGGTFTFWSMALRWDLSIEEVTHTVTPILFPNRQGKMTNLGYLIMIYHLLWPHTCMISQ